MQKESFNIKKENRLLNSGPVILVSVGDCSENTITPETWQMPVSSNPMLLGKVLEAYTEKDLMNSDGVLDISNKDLMHHLGGENYAVLQNVNS